MQRFKPRYNNQRGRVFGSNRFAQRRPNQLGQRRTTSIMDVSLLVKKAVQEEVVAFVPVHKFSDFSLDQQLFLNIEARGYELPTPIQDKGIPVLLQGRDVIGLANTGTGKTAAFLIPLIQKVMNDKGQRVLIVAPTRELAVQINDELKAFSRQLGIQSSVCIGGVSMGRQIFELKNKPNFVIGTPGRLKDLEQRRIISFGDFQSVVLDEVDRMLDMGFVKEIQEMIAKLPRGRQSLFFSATMPEKIRLIAMSFLSDPVTISVSTGKTSLNVDQDVVRVNGRQKVDILHELLMREEFEKTLVFGRTKHGIEKLVRLLEQRGINSVSIHGNKNQNQRQRALQLFKSNKVKVLLATDIASRGIDIEDVTHVVNFDIPETYEDYVHRIGRTGRAGKKGVALTLVD